MTEGGSEEGGLEELVEFFIDPFLQGGDPLFQRAHQRQDSRLCLGWNRIPDILWERRSIHHANVLLNSGQRGKIGS